MFKIIAMAPKVTNQITRNSTHKKSKNRHNSHQKKKKTFLILTTSYAYFDVFVATRSKIHPHWKTGVFYFGLTFLNTFSSEIALLKIRLIILFATFLMSICTSIVLKIIKIRILKSYMIFWF